MKTAQMKKGTKPRHSFKEPATPGSQFTYSLYTDGASRGNPGEAGAGIILKNSSGRTVRRMRKYLGSMTNNQAEYNALLLGLNLARMSGVKNLSVYLDSELIVRQVNGEYRVKNPEIKPLYRKVLQMLQEFDKINILHVPREMNGEADSLANQAIDLKDEEKTAGAWSPSES